MITVCIQRMGKVLFFRCVSVNKGEGKPHLLVPGPFPASGQMPFPGGTLVTFSFPGLVAGPFLWGGGTPDPGSFSGLWSQFLFRGYPVPAGGGGTSVLGYPLPPSETEQQSEFLLRGWRYAFCGHAGGLSCH